MLLALELKPVFYFRNVSVIEQHFEWMREANIGVVAVSWYPPGMDFRISARFWGDVCFAPRAENRFQGL